MHTRILFLTTLGSVAVTILLVVAAALIWREPIGAWFAVANPDTTAPSAAEARGAIPLATLANEESSASLVDVIAAANQAVVSVIATKDVPVYERYYEEYNPFGFGDGFAVPRVREQGTEEREVGGGSGFVVSADGLIVTNRHVVADESARYSVIFSDGETRDVSVLARDPVLDVAILSLDESTDEALPHLQFANSDRVQLGQTVVAIGNALAEFDNSVSVGVVSGLSRSITAQGQMGMAEQLESVIQTDAAINPGNSGGPLLNTAGEVVGVNVATSLRGENISFALPANAVAQVVTSVQETGEITRPFLGVRYAAVTPRMVELNDLPVSYGAIVLRGDTSEELAVLPGSPAASAGIREGDIILAVDGESLESGQLAQLLRRQEVGETVTLRVWRDGEEIDISVTLTDAP